MTEENKYVNENRLPLVTIGIVGVGVAIIELSALPFFAIGAASVLASKDGSKAFRKTIKKSYKGVKRLKELMAETQEMFGDVIAEVKAEEELAIETAEIAAEAL